MSKKHVILTQSDLFLVLPKQVVFRKNKHSRKRNAKLLRVTQFVYGTRDATTCMNGLDTPKCTLYIWYEVRAMTRASCDQLIVTLASMFAGKSIDTDTVRRALHEICAVFLFDSGIVYEIDQYNHFHAKELYTQQTLRHRTLFSIEDIDPAYRSRLAKEIVSCVDIHSEQLYEHNFLSFFYAEQLAVLSVVDENQRIIGFIVLLNAKFNKNTMAFYTKKDELATPLSLFGRYVSIRMYHNKLSFAQNALESILDNTGIDIYVNDFYTHDILYANKSMAAPYGGISQFYGKKCWEVLFPDSQGPCAFCPEKKLLDEHGVPSKIYSWDYQRPFDGAWFRVFSAVFRWVDGRLAHVVSSADITENKRYEQMIQYMAHYDSLTGLPNRRMLVADCEQRINHALPGEHGYVLFFDIDDFKMVNDTLGHDAGDELLIQLGAFFSSLPLLNKAMYRNGGDEFVALLGDTVIESQVLALAASIHERFDSPWNLQAGAIRCNTSIGVACYPQDGTTAEEILHQADQAMYIVKKNGGASIRFSSCGTGSSD